MSDQWRILVVEDEENLNWSIVNSLRKDGYFVQGVMSGAEAMRILWSEEYDVVISDLKMPGADGFELLQWIRAHRPRTRLIMVTAFGSPSTRTQALEGGVVSYLEKPFDLHTLKEELRRLLQQTGFSANLDSFDLLDVIQIINMSRKTIALLVNTGLEERGVLRFHNGELIWAEYGVLRGEEAFFALAAHKNGVVVHQPWNDRITPNVTQPLSRLIFQALQYRTKYAAGAQHSSEHEVVKPFDQSSLAQEDDTPFLYLNEAEDTKPQPPKEWWQQTDRIPLTDDDRESKAGSDGSIIIPSTVRKTPASQRTDLPSWLTDQPTASVPSVRRSSLSNSGQVPVTPVLKSSPAEWQPVPPSVIRTPGTIPAGPMADPQKPPVIHPRPRQPSSPEWDLPPTPRRMPSGPLKSIEPRKDDTAGASPEPGKLTSIESLGQQQATGRNYSTLVSSLKTLGYSVPGFVATAVVTLDGQPIAQVAVDDVDISPLYDYFSAILQGALLSLKEVKWGNYEDTVVTSGDRHILLRLPGKEKDVFHVLITTREADPLESLEMMTNVGETIDAALH